VLLQTRQRRRDARVTSDCAKRLDIREQSNSACVVVKENRALLVWLPYGGSPGWDLPGGWRHDGEPACETAEREVCEETGLQVRAVEQLSYNVFKCEVVAEGVCRNPVDEGHLDKRWVASWDLGSLQFRGGTWGNKRGLLEDQLASGDAFAWADRPVALASTKLAVRARARGVTSDCANRLNMWSQRDSACIVLKENRALLVWVPYGSEPGWDLPGGYRLDNEPACETAEREVCEETGFQVRAIAQLSYNVFQCEVVAANVCKNPVDEGFLDRRWVSRPELDALQYRGGTWGDKQSLLISQLANDVSQPSEQPAWLDVCGCKMCHGEGYSTGSGHCMESKTTEVTESCKCLREHTSPGQDMIDECGCRPCDGEGWSSTAGRCAQGSDTDPREACQCQKSGGRPVFVQLD